MAMFAAVFFGNKLIAVSQGLFLLGLVFAAKSGELGKPGWKQLRASSWFLLAFAFVSLLSILINWDSHLGSAGALKKLRYFALLLLLLLFPRIREKLFGERDLRTLYHFSWWIPMVIAVGFGLVHFFWRERIPFLDGVGYPGRVSGFYGQAMTFAYILQFSMVFLLIELFERSSIAKLSDLSWKWAVPLFVICGAALYFSYSRGAVLAAAIAMILFCLMSRRWVVIGGLVALAVGIGVYASKEKNAGASGPRYFDFSDSARVNQWKCAGLTFLEHPVWGVGYKNYEMRSVELKKEYGLPPDVPAEQSAAGESRYLRLHAHNNYLEAFAATGVFGGLCFIGFVLTWLREAWQTRFKVFLCPLVVTFLVSGLFENTFYDSEVMSCIFLMYFCTQGALDRERVDA
jgi:O-antigen ligase